jgi:hypothetical protein
VAIVREVFGNPGMESLNGPLKAESVDRLQYADHAFGGRPWRKVTLGSSPHQKSNGTER